jgi:hypothetical protein
MNQVFSEQPSLAGKHYVHRTPEWLVALVRLAFGIAAIGVAAMTYQDWRGMPFGFRALSCVLVPAFAFFALSQQMWRKTIKFIATDEGIFFPCNELVVTTIGQDFRSAWLLVPWKNIANARLAKVHDNDNSLATCLALDLKVSPEEEAAFFRHVDAPTDRASHEKKVLSVAYSSVPPSPKKALRLLKALRPGI